MELELEQDIADYCTQLDTTANANLFDTSAFGDMANTIAA